MKHKMIKEKRVQRCGFALDESSGNKNIYRNGQFYVSFRPGHTAKVWIKIPVFVEGKEGFGQAMRETGENFRFQDDV